MDREELENTRKRSRMAESCSIDVVKNLLAHIYILEEWCIQCGEDNDSREHLDMCESCEIQNKMDELKRRDL